MPTAPVLVVAALTAWCALTAVVHRSTRFGRPAPGPAVAVPPDGLSPGVVAFLCAGPDTDRAAAATVLDLAARGVLVLEPAAAGPATVRPGGPADGLDRLEALVVARVRALGQGAPVPLPALVARAGTRGGSDDVGAALVGTTRALGLTRPRAGAAGYTVLAAAALLPAAALGALAAQGPDVDDPAGSFFAVAAVFLTVLVPVVRLFRGERLTLAGRRAASAWLGHGVHLGRDELLRAAAPADVALWGRRLAVAQALGVARVPAGFVRLGPGRRTRIWSGFGGRWREVEVRYPRGLLTGRTAPMTTVYALWLVVVVAASAFWMFWLPAQTGWPTKDPAVRAALRTTGVLVVVGVAAYALLRILGTTLEVGAEREVVGEVLWVEEHHGGVSENSSWVETFHLAVDDGRSDRTTAYALPAGLRQHLDAGDHVRLRVRPFSRTVTSVERVEVASGR